MGAWSSRLPDSQGGYDMATLTFWIFDSPGGAASLAARLDTLAKEGALDLVDGAVVEWAESSKKPHTTQLRYGVEKTIGGSLGIGRLTGGRKDKVEGSLRLAGLDDEAIGQVRDELMPGTSTLVLSSTEANPSRLVEAFGGPLTRARLIHSNLSEADEAELRRTFIAG
jgi:uncharacterized membrane protein